MLNKKRLLLGVALGLTTLSLMGCTGKQEEKTTEASQTTDLPENYQKIVKEYSDIIKEIKSGKEIDDISGSYPDVAIGSFNMYIEDNNIDGSFYYATYDLNKDGKDELVIGRKYDEGDDEDIKVIGLFADKEGQAQSLLAVEGLDATAAFAYEIPVHIYSDSQRYTIDMVSADEGIYVYQIGEDGYTPEKVEMYKENYVSDGENEEFTYVTEDGKSSLTGDEMNELLGFPAELEYKEIK